MYEHIDRVRRKQEAAELLRDAQVSPKGMTALYMLLVLVLGLASTLSSGGFLQVFISIFAELLTTVLGAGFTMYCMAIRRRERAEYLTLFDGFSLVGKLILLTLVMGLFITLWSMLFFIPGIIAAYRYQFALFNLFENPSIGVMEALDMSKRQTYGYKLQLFVLDLSYLGWALLAAFPALYLLFLINRDVTMALLYNSMVPETYFGLPIIVLDLLTGLWQLVVSLFYLPNCHCVRLAYFDTAKRTSGVGEGVDPQPSQWDGWNAPDGLS